MSGAETGSEVMQRIAAPMVGGMITAPLLSMFVVPAVYLLLRRRHLNPESGKGGDANVNDQSYKPMRFTELLKEKHHA